MILDCKNQELKEFSKISEKVPTLVRNFLAIIQVRNKWLGRLLVFVKTRFFQLSFIPKAVIKFANNFAV